MTPRLRLNSMTMQEANLRQQQVEQTPELLKLVLQWGASEQEAALGDEAVQVPGQLALPVLHALRFINDHILPFHLPTAAHHTHTKQMLHVVKMLQMHLTQKLNTGIKLIAAWTDMAGYIDVCFCATQI